MGLYLKKRLDNQTVIGVWRATEPTYRLERLLNSAQLQEIYRFRNEKRRREKLAVRILLNNLAGVDAEIIYDSNGKPRLANRPYSISISHSGDFVAIILSYKNEVGIDIQYMSDKVQRVAAKFLHPDEYRNIKPFDTEESLHVHWCAKETLYKIHGKGQLNFANNLRILPFDFNNEGKIKASIHKDALNKEYELNYTAMNDQYMMVWGAN